jgi:hypothetical protein
MAGRGIPNPVGEQFAGSGLEDVACQVRAQIRIAVAFANGIAKPRVGDTVDMGIEAGKGRIVVIPDWSFMRESGPMAQQKTQGNLVLRSTFKATLHRPFRQIGGDRLIQVQQPLLNGEQDRNRRQVLRSRLDAEHRVGIDRLTPLLRHSKALYPYRKTLVNQADSNAFYSVLNHVILDRSTLLFHQLVEHRRFLQILRPRFQSEAGRSKEGGSRDGGCRALQKGTAIRLHQCVTPVGS